MKRKSSGGGRIGDTSTKKKKMMKGSLATHLAVQIGQISFKPPTNKQGSSSLSLRNPSRFQNSIDSKAQGAPKSYHCSSTTTLELEADVDTDDKHFILSQDFFCTPDYITPEAPPVPSSFSFNQEDLPCPRSPEKVKTVKSKRQRQGLGVANEILETDGRIIDETAVTEPPKSQGYVSQSAVALRCRIMPPPCIKNPYLKDSTEDDIDPFGNRRSKCAGFLPAFSGGEGLSRYRTDFHEIEQIGNGNFSRVFKVLKRIDGCMYAVKQSTRPLHQDNERLKALMEVQALASLEFYENVVGYYTSWFENEQLYIQMELCDHSLSVNQFHKLCPEGKVLEAMHQIAKALQFIHEKGIAHLDLKPENIYVKNGVYKLGDFGCATLLDKSLPIEEGDARYMPQEILNDNYDHLDKVDIFSLGAAIYELVKGSTLPESGPHFLNLREGKLPLLPGRSVQFQNLLKAMMDPDPVRRPSAKELVENPIFERRQKTTTNVRAAITLEHHMSNMQAEAYGHDGQAAYESHQQLRRYDSLDIESTKVRSHNDKGVSWSIILQLVFQSIGVVYGDIGTSPLYVYASTFSDGIKHNDDILGLLSLILYTLTLIPLIKYVFVVLLANDNGNDVGHFTVRSIQTSMCTVTYPALILSYTGQASFLHKNEHLVSDTFFKSTPHNMFWPMFIVVILAAIIASQAMISATFSSFSSPSH